MRCLICLGFALCLQAAPLVVPEGYSTLPGDGGTYTLIRDLDNPRTYQIQIAASELDSLGVGDLIQGISWRLWNNQPAAFPDADTNWSDYEITLAEAAHPIEEMSTVYAENMLHPVLVRDGPLHITARAFPSGSSPNAFGTAVAFDEPYAYRGGDLVILLTHTGSDRVGIRYLDSLTVSAPGYGTSYRALFTDSFHAASTPYPDTSFIITALEVYSAVPEPSTVWGAGAGILLAFLLTLRKTVALKPNRHR